MLTRESTGMTHKKVRKAEPQGVASRSSPKKWKPWEKNSIFSRSSGVNMVKLPFRASKFRMISISE